MNRRLPLLLLLAVLGAVWLRPAAAHPHVWIETVTTFIFEDGHLVAIRQSWRFDPLYSSYVIQDNDLDGDGTLDAEEEARTLDKAFAALPEASYFTRLFVDDAVHEVREVHDQRVTLDGDTIEYAFTTRLPEPLDPRVTDVKLGAYDESYYVDLAYDEMDPVRFEGIDGSACHFAILENAVEPIYYGMVVPPVIGLRCGTS